MRTTTSHLTGYAAIEYADAHELTLSKHSDTTEEARDGLTPDEAREVASEDPSLIWLDTSITRPERLELYESGAGHLYWHAVGTGLVVGDIGGVEDSTALTDARLWSEWVADYVEACPKDLHTADPDWLLTLDRVAVYRDDALHMSDRMGAAAARYIGIETDGGWVVEPADRIIR